MDHIPEEIQNPTPPWMRKVQRFLAMGQKAKALEVIEHAIEYNMPLFPDDETVREDRRHAWLYRIDILRELGKYSEALAWICLECEMHPDNVAALALKEELKIFLHLTPAQKDSKNVGLRRKENDGLWDGVAGMREVKATLQTDIILPIRSPDLYKRFKLTLPHGVLFYGPPGCGKTFIARKLAKILKFNFIEAKPSDLGSIYIHGAQEKIAELFSNAKKHAPTLIFLDEIDALVPNRADGISKYKSDEVNEFLVHLNDCWKSKTLVIGATNLIEKLDPAILRPGRFDKKIFIGPPDLEARLGLLKLYMTDRPQEKINWIDVADKCDFHTCAEIEHIVNEAARYAVKVPRSITETDLLKAIEKNPPAYDSQRIENMKAHIGFV